MFPAPELTRKAIDAAIAVAGNLGLGRITPIVLHHSQRVSIRLFPLDVVAKVAKIENLQIDAKMRRELAVVWHLVQKGAPIVPPTAQHFAGPHYHETFALTLWKFVDHVATDPNSEQHVAQAAAALHNVHAALADFPDELPHFTTKIDESRTLLEDTSALLAIRAADRAFLLATYQRIFTSLGTFSPTHAPIHGDTHLGNVLITPNGALWNDFEDASLGPREWDVAWITDANLSAFEPIDRQLLATLRALRSLCVTVWCWNKYHIAEKQEAAHYHLDWLREHFA
jgi:Ser/Thr protein kinase RdoA (MazF antagonist)